VEHIYSKDEIKHIIVKTNHFINEHILSYNKAIKRIICNGSISKDTIESFRSFKNCSFDEYIDLISRHDKKYEYIELISVHDDFHELISEMLSRHLSSRPISENLSNDLYFCHVTLLNILHGIIDKLDSTKSQLDKLTNTWNREIFIKFIDREYLEVKKGKASFCLTYFCIDQFREINEEYNYNIGDAILKELILLVKNCLREYDSISRWTGAEFLILFPDTSLESAVELIEKIKQMINQKIFVFDSKEIQLSCSFGITLSSIDKDVKSTIDEAINLLYSAKSKGKNQIETSK